MDDPQRDVGAPIFTASPDDACDDAQLLRRIGQGDEDAMATFYREHGRVVLAQVLLVVGERVLAEEIVQDAMLAVWRGAGSFRGESSARSWVIAIAWRQTRDRLRGRRRSPHLDLGDLIAEVNGQAIDDQAREHLTRCEHCRAELNRWDLVAGGVRGLAAATPDVAQPARPRLTRPGVPAGPRRRTVLAASAAAAVVLLGAAGYAATTALTRHPSGTVLTAVGGCATLRQAEGTLEQANGARLLIKTASGQPVTVTTTPSTFVSMSGPLLGDITDGASVMVRGHRSGGAVAAAIVTVGPPFSAVNPAGFVPVQGTVSGASTAGFTLVTSSGSRVRVTTSGDTLVVVPHASVGQLRKGTTIFALGSAGPDGTLTARGVAAVSQLPAGARLNVTTRSCSPASIAAALVSGG